MTETPIYIGAFACINILNIFTLCTQKAYEPHSFMHVVFWQERFQGLETWSWSGGHAFNETLPDHLKAPALLLLFLQMKQHRIEIGGLGNTYDEGMFAEGSFNPTTNSGLQRCSNHFPVWSNVWAFVAFSSCHPMAPLPLLIGHGGSPVKQDPCQRRDSPSP